MIHDIHIEPRHLKLIEEGLVTFHQLDNLPFDIQQGDIVHLYPIAEGKRFKVAPVISVGVTHVRNNYMPANWVTFCFKVLSNEESLMSWGMSSGTPGTFNASEVWERLGYATEDDFKRDKDIDLQLSRKRAYLENKKVCASTSKRIAELEEEKEQIQARMKLPQEIA